MPQRNSRNRSQRGGRGRRNGNRGRSHGNANYTSNSSNNNDKRNRTRRNRNTGASIKRFNADKAKYDARAGKWPQQKRDLMNYFKTNPKYSAVFNDELQYVTMTAEEVNACIEDECRSTASMALRPSHPKNEMTGRLIPAHETDLDVYAEEMKEQAKANNELQNQLQERMTDAIEAAEGDEAKGLLQAKLEADSAMLVENEKMMNKTIENIEEYRAAIVNWRLKHPAERSKTRKMMKSIYNMREGGDDWDLCHEYEKNQIIRDSERDLYTYLCEFLGASNRAMINQVKAGQGLELWRILCEVVQPKGANTAMNVMQQLMKMRQGPEKYKNYVLRVDEKAEEYNEAMAGKEQPLPNIMLKMIKTQQPFVHNRYKEVCEYVSNSNATNDDQEMTDDEITSLFIAWETRNKYNPNEKRKDTRRDTRHNNRDQANSTNEESKSCTWCAKYLPERNTYAPHTHQTCYTRQNQSNPDHEKYVECPNHSPPQVGHSAKQCPTAKKNNKNNKKQANAAVSDSDGYDSDRTVATINKYMANLTSATLKDLYKRTRKKEKKKARKRRADTSDSE